MVCAPFVIEVSGLCKDYGTTVAVDDLSFRVEPGEIVGFLGPNGAGKTTTLRILAGAMGKTRGQVRLAGYDLDHEPMKARASLGYLPEAVPLYPELRVIEYLRFRAGIKPIRWRDRSRQIERAMERAQVAEMAWVPVGHLSKGYRQRVGLADALLGDPPLYILDEPSAGLDPNQIREFRQLLQELKGKHTVLLSSHVLGEIEATCDRAIVIQKGRLVGSGSLGELERSLTEPRLRLRISDPNRRASQVFQARGVTAVGGSTERTETSGSQLEDEGPAPSAMAPFSEVVVSFLPPAVSTSPSTEAEPARAWQSSSLDREIEALVRALVEAGIGVLAVSEQRPRLEDVFVALTAKAGEAEPLGTVDGGEQGPADG